MSLGNVNRLSPRLEAKRAFAGGLLKVNRFSLFAFGLFGSMMRLVWISTSGSRMLQFVVHLGLCLPLALCPVLCGVSAYGCADQSSERATGCCHGCGSEQSTDDAPATDHESCCTECQCICGGAIVVQSMDIDAPQPASFVADFASQINDDVVVYEIDANCISPSERLSGRAMRIQIASFLL
jgi:hypothetical protein